MGRLTEPPLSLYVHFPWCVQKCPYCDFNSHALKDDSSEERYIEALLKDLDEELARAPDRKILSMFFGGGTPSLMSAGSVEKIIDKLVKAGRIESDVEITLEANPGTRDAGRFRGYRSAGVNRLSIGIQSLGDEMLKKLGRIHNGAEAAEAVDYARKAGFNNLNLDLMFGLPGQTLKQAKRDLTGLLAFAPEHISYYQLTLEPNTLFYAKPPDLPEDELIEEIHQVAVQRLADSGFQRYEVSAFAREGRQCRHNLNYWLFGDYIGVGAGAHGKITDADKVIRYSKPRHPRQYSNLESNFRQAVRTIGDRDLRFEFMLNALRLTQGFNLSDFEDRTGLNSKDLQPELQPLMDKQLMIRTGDHLNTSALGYRYLNDVIEAFLP